MKQEFEMTDLGKMKYFLGIEVTQTTTSVFICQQKYAKEILERFGMENSKAVILLCLEVNCQEMKMARQ